MSITRDLPANSHIFQQTEKTENGYYFPPTTETGWFLYSWNGQSALWARHGQLPAAYQPAAASFQQQPASNVTSINRPLLPPNEMMTGKKPVPPNSE